MPPAALPLLRSRFLPLVAGAAAAAVLFGPARVPADARPGGGAALRLVLDRTGELDVAPAGELLAAPNLRPGHARVARITLANRTGSPLRLQLRAQAATRELDAAVVLRIRAGRRVLYRGALGRLRGGTRALALPVASRVRLTVRAGIRAGARGIEGRSAVVTLEAAA